MSCALPPLYPSFEICRRHSHHPALFPDHAVSHDDGEFLSKISAVHCSGNFLFARMEDDEKTKKKLAYFFLFFFFFPSTLLFPICFVIDMPYPSPQGGGSSSSSSLQYMDSVMSRFGHHLSANERSSFSQSMVPTLQSSAPGPHYQIPPTHGKSIPPSVIPSAPVVHSNTSSSSSAALATEDVDMKQA